MSNENGQKLYDYFYGSPESPVLIDYEVMELFYIVFHIVSSDWLIDWESMKSRLEHRIPTICWFMLLKQMFYLFIYFILLKCFWGFGLFFQKKRKKITSVLLAYLGATPQSWPHHCHAQMMFTSSRVILRLYNYTNKNKMYNQNISS